MSYALSGLGQTPESDARSAQYALQIAANLTSMGAQLVSNPQRFAQTQAPVLVNVLDQTIVSPLVDRATQRATPYLIQYMLPPLTVLYVLSGLAAFYSYETLKNVISKRGLAANRRTRRNRRCRR